MNSQKLGFFIFILNIFLITKVNATLNCSAEEYLDTGRFQLTCLKPEAEFFTWGFFTTRCHCAYGMYKLDGKCVDVFNCMLACAAANENATEGAPEVECFCNTATRTIHNQVLCAWNAFNPASRALKHLYVQDDPLPDFIGLDD